MENVDRGVNPASIAGWQNDYIKVPIDMPSINRHTSFLFLMTQLLRIPCSEGIRRPPRNFLTDGTALHQALKSVMDMTSSFESPDLSEKEAALINILTKSSRGLKPCSVFFVEKMVSCIDFKTASRSDLG